jgi:hypothetical protein
MYAGRLGDHIALYETLSRHMVLVPVEEIPTLAIRRR